MKTIKLDIKPTDTIVFAADIHLKTSWSAKLFDVKGDAQAGLDQLLEAVRVAKARLLILGGDVFDSRVIREAELITMFQKFVDAVMKENCIVAAYPGNHDRVFAANVGDVVHQWYEVHPGVVNVDGAVFYAGDRTCYAMGFCDNPVEAAAAMSNVPADVNTVFLHQNIRGVGLPSFNLDEDIIPSTVDEIYIGDIHMPIQGTTRHGAIWAYPGPMFPQEFGEDHCGVLVFPAAAPRRGSASWARARLRCRPTKVIDATMLGNSDDLLVDRIITETVAWANAQKLATLKPIVNIKLLSSARQHVAKLKAGITAGCAARVSVTYAPPVQSTSAAVKGTSKTIPPPEQLIQPYLETLRSADGTYRALRRPIEAAALMKALFELRPGDETAKGRETAYRSVIKSHLDTLT